MPASRTLIRITVSFLLLFLLAPGAGAQYRHKTLLTDRFIHEPVATDDCSVCHDLHFPEAPGQLSEPVPDLCTSCHDDPASGKRIVHEPVVRGACLDCHYPHSAPVRALLRSEARRICVTCHGDKLDGLHGSLLLEGICLDCHDPHASDSEALLVGSTGGRCGACHPGMDTGTSRHSPLDDMACDECHDPHSTPPKPTTACTQCHSEVLAGALRHDALEEGCRACHDAHSGPNTDQLLKTVPDLCLECHDSTEPGRHSEMGAGLDCVRCHNPHTSSAKGLLKENVSGAPCASCHVDVILAQDQHTPVRENRCRICHDPHSQSPAQALICRDCHPGIMNEGTNHQPALESCENCHDPHGSKYPYHLRKATPALCLECHDDKEDGRHDGTKMAGRCVSCHDPHSAARPSMLKVSKEGADCDSCHLDQEAGSVVHTPMREAGCSKCHDPHASPPGPWMGCLDCHGSVILGENRHEAVEEGCGVCHRTHSGEVGYLLVGEIPELCLSCHGDKEGGRHGNTRLSTRCTQCHDPHAAEGRMLLRSSGEKECTDCHSAQSESEYLHSALEEYGCRECHNPHRDPPEMPPVACRECHGDISQRSAAHASPSHDLCIGCHDPHGSRNAGLLRNAGPVTEGRCLDCHADVGRALENARNIHEPLAQGGCSDCHDAHVGEAPFTVEPYDGRKNVPWDPGAYALCFMCHDQALVQSGSTETETGFRQLRWNLHNLHVMRDSERGFSCWVCHSPHATRQPHLIKMEVPMSSAYSLEIRYRETENGGQCVTSCHGPQEYSR